jgi:mannose-6-phosphate isomerase
VNPFDRPLTFEPLYFEKPWGGRRLSDLLDKEMPLGKPIGEAWELSGLPGSLSRCTTEGLSGLSINDLISRSPADLLGACSAANEFPLLYKFIDAQQKLSVQVHPDDDDAHRRSLTNGKTECWYIVDAAPGAGLLAGFKKGIDKAAIIKSVADNSMYQILNTVPVTRGDVLFIPAGTVHAITEGIVVYEVQQSSDVTFRLYDWGRVDNNGKPRTLHIEESLAVMNDAYQDMGTIEPVLVEQIDGYTHTVRVVCRYFSMEECGFLRPASFILQPKSSCVVMTVLSGILSVRCHDGSEVVFSKGATALFPALMMQKPVTMYGDHNTRFLFSYVPDILKEIIRPLKERGVADLVIRRLGGVSPGNDLLRFLG